MPLDVGLEIQRRRAEMGAYNAWIVDELRPYVGRQVLDVGCCTGNILAHFLDRERVIGIDIGEEFIAEARHRFGDRSNFRAEVADVTDPGMPTLVKEPIDTVICVNVLEHIEDDAGALRNMNRVLEPGGRVLLFVPAHPFLHGTMDEVDGHHRRYSKADLRRKLESASFSVEAAHHMNLPGMIAWFIDGKLLRRRYVPASHDGLFQRLVPRIAAVERRFRPPAGLSLVMVGRRIG